MIISDSTADLLTSQLFLLPSGEASGLPNIYVEQSQPILNGLEREVDQDQAHAKDTHPSFGHMIGPHSTNGVHDPIIAVTTPMPSPAVSLTASACSRCCATRLLTYPATV